MHEQGNMTLPHMAPHAGPQATKVPAGRWAYTGLHGDLHLLPKGKEQVCPPGPQLPILLSRSSSPRLAPGAETEQTYWTRSTHGCPPGHHGAPTTGGEKGEETQHHLRCQPSPGRPASPSGSTHRTPHGAASCAVCTGHRGPRCSCAPASRCWHSRPRRVPGGQQHLSTPLTHCRPRGTP